jgi:prepilin-type N-terminal cleavage/methylation domain-containing protein
MRISICRSRSASRAAAKSSDGRNGFVLVEVIVAMVLLAVAVTSLAGLVYSVSHSGIRTAGDAYKNGVLMQEVNRLVGLPYDSIPNGASYVQVSSPPYQHMRVISVTEPVVNVVKSIKIVITPTNPQYKPDSVTFVRTKARTSRVLCTTCPQG